MRRFIPAMLAAFLTVAACPLSAHESTDARGRTLLWGDRVRGKRLSLCMPCTRLRYGQPVVVFVRSTNDGGEAPYLRIRWEGDPPTTRLELRSSSGAGTSTTPQVCGFASAVSGSCASVRVVPRGTTALGRHFRPGRYRVAVVYRKQADPCDPKAWIGELRSNEIEFEVIDAKLRDGVQWVPKQVRTWAAEQIARLGHQNPEARREAETGLFNAAREGSRLGVVYPGDASAIEARVREMANNLDDSRIKVRVACERPSSGSFVSCTSPMWQPGDATRVTVDYQYSMFFPLLFGTELPLSSEAKMRIE